MSDSSSHFPLLSSSTSIFNLLVDFGGVEATSATVYRAGNFSREQPGHGWSGQRSRAAGGTQESSQLRQKVDDDTVRTASHTFGRAEEGGDAGRFNNRQPLTFPHRRGLSSDDIRVFGFGFDGSRSAATAPSQPWGSLERTKAGKLRRAERSAGGVCLCRRPENKVEK